jgi:hypothetical protein
VQTTDYPQTRGPPLDYECSGAQLEFHGLRKRAVVARFDGGHISSDGGALLLREVDTRTRIMARMAERFTDYRDPELIEQSVETLVAQRVLGLALGYPDLNDHDRLRFDALLALAVGKRDPNGQDRRHECDKGKALASSSTLNRLKPTLAEVAGNQRYFAPDCAPPRTTRATVVSRSSRASCRRRASTHPRPASASAGIRGSAARRSWPGETRTGSATCSGGPRLMRAP